MAVAVVHHPNKAQGVADPFDLISGSNGLAACADTTLILDRDGQGVRLYGRGRDVEEFDKALSFDAVHGRWSILGQAEDVRRSDGRNSILTVLRGSLTPLGPKEIAVATGMKGDNVRYFLGQMAQKGEVEKAKYGAYTAPSTSPSQPSHPHS